ncbi:hypothetical protein H0E87_015629 [Populus deltoides]|uniref:ZZ-type zinc finger-containing protein 3 n=1 Tax=Populus deltoides TaxID=3696 RepID=A0A8T2Y5W1_POPDE|nr:hypothetical protein H0E87_015629 [Populus deltoides]KAH8500452.1 hypothetical protein H0E87_015629 [Populus deltoides]
MAAESNTGFHLEGTLGSALNRHAISFQSGAINSGCTTNMIPMGMGSYFGINTSTTSSSLMLPGSSSLISNNTSPGGSGSGGIVQAQAGNSSASSSLLLDSVPGLKHDAGLAVEWSVEEQYKLEEGLQKYADEPSILRYIKIAAMLRDKTVRDVALRCRWMTRKRRKAEDYNMGKKINSRKDKLVESSSKMNMAAGLLQNVASYPLMMHHTDQSETMPFEGISGTTRLLDQNAQAFSQISANLSTFKLQDNIDFFCYTRNNITAILNDMREMPGIMSRMPPLPVSIDEDLANSILPNTIQVIYKQLVLIAHFNGRVTTFFMCCHIKTHICQ